MKNITKKIIELGGKSSNLKTTMKKMPIEDRKKWSGKEGLILQDLVKFEEKEDLKLVKKIQAENAKNHNLSIREYILLQEKAIKILGAFDTGHSMGCYRSLILNGKSFASAHTTEMYSKSCKYSPTYGSIKINLNKKELREIQEIGHVWTIKGKRINSKVFDERHLQPSGSKNNYSVDFIKGYITSNFHAETIAGAMAWRKMRAKILLNSRNEEIEKDKLKKRFVGFQHSLNAGNCQSGTMGFCQRNGLNPEMGYRLDYILSLENSEFTNLLFSTVKL